MDLFGAEKLLFHSAYLATLLKQVSGSPWWPIYFFTAHHLAEIMRPLRNRSAGIIPLINWSSLVYLVRTINSRPQFLLVHRFGPFAFESFTLGPMKTRSFRLIEAPNWILGCGMITVQKIRESKCYARVLDRNQSDPERFGHGPNDLNGKFAQQLHFGFVWSRHIDVICNKLKRSTVWKLLLCSWPND